ncbi:hypothetical protein BDZ89DRAFT_746863 [Hymenopellis radicata]|nr:hypothetical protein BDZ89DRAFT_746863 [Hymenopellis radicata]
MLTSKSSPRRSLVANLQAAMTALTSLGVLWVSPKKNGWRLEGQKTELSTSGALVSVAILHRLQSLPPGCRMDIVLGSTFSSQPTRQCRLDSSDSSKKKMTFKLRLPQLQTPTL